MFPLCCCGVNLGAVTKLVHSNISFSSSSDESITNTFVLTSAMSEATQNQKLETKSKGTRCSSVEVACDDDSTQRDVGALSYWPLRELTRSSIVPARPCGYDSVASITLW